MAPSFDEAELKLWDEVRVEPRGGRAGDEMQGGYRGRAEQGYNKARCQENLAMSLRTKSCKSHANSHEVGPPPTTTKESSLYRERGRHNPERYLLRTLSFALPHVKRL